MNVNESESFVPRIGYICNNASWVNVLAMSGIEVSSSDVFFSGGGDQDMFFETYLIDETKGFMNNNDIRFFFEEEMKKVDSCIIISVRADKLTYNSLFSQNSLEYGHCINIINANEDGVYFIDGYVDNVKGNGYRGFITYKELDKAWALEGYKYWRITRPTHIKVDKIKEDAKQAFILYIVRNYIMCTNDFQGVPQNNVLFQFWSLICKIQKEKEINIRYMESFLAKIKVDGFLVEKNMIWEKINEYAPSYKEEYYDIIKKWRHILLVLRKHSVCNQIDRLIMLYSDIQSIVRREEVLLTEIVQNIENDAIFTFDT